MLKNAKIRVWLETIITNLDGLALNPDKHLTFAQQATKLGTPVATVVVRRGSVKPQGQKLDHIVPIDISIVAREDGDYEQTMDDLFKAIESDAFPDFKEDGDSNSSAGYVDGYDWDVWEMASEGKITGKIVILMIVNLKYSNISNRM